MTADRMDLLGPNLTKIGNETLRLADGDGNGIFLYVEIGDGWTGSSLFKDDGDVIRYIDFDDLPPLDDLLTEAWSLEQWTSGGLRCITRSKTASSTRPSTMTN